MKNCYKCHSAESTKLKGELLLDTREGALKGGKTGPAVVPGDLEKSLLIKAVRYKDEDLQMPPKGEKLSDAQISDLEAWVKMGAPDPRTVGKLAGSKTDAAKSHWAFQPVTKPLVPTVKQSDWIQTPVDAFILQKLEQNGMKPSPAADKATLIRRATFDLTGLPPTQKEIDTFLQDDSSKAFEKVVDRLLGSPQYGERWGRYWLDVARYSDTKGEIDRKKETPVYPYAWTYRDYVIRSFNEDKPYNRFILEQVAADRLPLGADKSALAALGFLTLGDHFKGNMNDVINDRIDVTTKGLLGLTVACARCHDHMFDPIPTQDYYSLRGIFASSAEPASGPVIGPPQNKELYADYLKQHTALEKELQLYSGKNIKGANKKAMLKKKVETMGKLDALEMSHPGAPVKAMVLEDMVKPQDSRVFLRGEAENKGEIAPRRFLQVLSPNSRQPFKIGSGRLELANAIGDNNNPLTARVMVNRIWLHHFGEGIVTTPDDFGTQSAPPSHPELLDYLANQFMENGWSIKKMHKLIMLSNAYQQSSENNPRYAQLDPYNRLLWRANIRRLDFEALRDSLLAIGGKLDTNMFGRPVPLASGNGRRRKIAGVLQPGVRPQEIGYTTRRTVYGYVDRGDLPEVFNHFDFANPDMETGKRYETTVPQQALYLMNSPLVVEQARNLAERPEVKRAETDIERIEALYRIAYQRPPRPEEIKLGLEFLEEAAPRTSLPTLETNGKNVPQRRPAVRKANRQVGIGNRPNGPANRRPLTAWSEYAHAMLLANEAAFVN
ncbi:MAG TPA: PSD1 and planctomycete cytochrome C domain-containing protein [Candidatus Saccharimonadales bacterium]|nr:PSD1 and planctomycete cytochrome C domain-containing protein [Candidatus Saccharimonadales bacterium]